MATPHTTRSAPRPPVRAEASGLHRAATTPDSNCPNCGPPMVKMLFTAARCSSANTLRIQRLEFGCEQLTKGPNVIRHACRHRCCALPPPGLNRAVACTLVQRQRLPQAHVRSGHIVEDLERGHPLPHTLAVFTEAGRLTHQWSQGLTQGQVHAFDQSRADREAQLCQAFGAK